MSRNQPRQTKEEAQRNKIIKAGGCMLTWLKFGEKKYAEIHHITIPGKRLGHAYTIPLSPWYHRGVCDPGKTKEEMRTQYGASLTDGTHAFVASHHYTELELWQKLQVALGLDDSLPTTKRVPRRLRGNPELPSDVVEFLARENPVPQVFARGAPDAHGADLSRVDRSGPADSGEVAS